LEDARRRWEEQSNVNTPAELLVKSDRMDMCHYELTGDFGINGQGPDCGSITWFDCPPDTSPLFGGESVFRTVEFDEVFAYSGQHGVSVVKAAEGLIFTRLQRARIWAVSKKVTMEFRLGFVEMNTKEISLLNPRTMSWNNVLDYFPTRRDFHDVAKSCSAANGGTIHHGYSMNWNNSYAGTYIIDFWNQKFFEFRKKMTEVSHELTRKMYQDMNLLSRLRVPRPVDPALILVSYFLQLPFYKHWISFFFGPVQPCLVANMDHNLPSPLCVANTSSIFFTWSYDMNAKIEPVSNVADRYTVPFGTMFNNSL
jgi:hypothetical protein